MLLPAEGEGEMSTGLWNDPNVPKRGWQCDDINDLGAPDQICAMCCVQEIRYVHTMTHPFHPALEVGCICAGHMEGSLDAARTREKDFKSRLRKRETFALRGWRMSQAGRPWRRHGGCRLVIFHEPGRGYSARGYIETPDGGSGMARTSDYTTEHEAKLAALDLEEKLQSWRRSR